MASVGRTFLAACTMAPSRLCISSIRATGASAVCVGQDARSSSAALSVVGWSFSNALCCGPGGLTISSMRFTGSLVKLVDWSLQSEARLVAPEGPLAAVPRPCPMSSAPIASRRCLCSLFSESYKVASAGRTTSIALIVASRRLSTASSRASGVSGG